MAVPPGAVALDGAANATSRNPVNMFPRGASVVLRKSHDCSKGPSSSESNETVSLVYATNLDRRLGVIKDIDDAHHWTDFSSVSINPSMPAEGPKDSLVVFWYPKHIKIELPEGDLNVSLQADELCHQMTLETARQHMANGIMEDSEIFQKAKANSCKEARLFVEAYEERMSSLRKADHSVFPLQLSGGERQSLLAKLSEKSGVASTRISVQPFAALFGGDDECAKCCDYNLMAAFHTMIMTRGDCVFCPTSDFVVQKAKKPNLHGCALELSYGKSYCTHLAKETQWQMQNMFPGLGGSGTTTSAKDCKVRLA